MKKDYLQIKQTISYNLFFLQIFYHRYGIQGATFSIPMLWKGQTFYKAYKYE